MKGLRFYSNYKLALQPAIALTLWMTETFMTPRSETRAVAKNQHFLKPSPHKKTEKGNGALDRKHRKYTSFIMSG